MKKIKLLLIMLLVIFITTGCSDNTITSTTAPSVITTTKEQAYLIGIEVTNVNQTVYLNQNYTFNGKVYAIYSDNTRKDVTRDAKFSAVVTSSLGKKTLTVSYSNYSKSFEILVIATAISRIELDTSNVKTVYKTKEVFNKDGLIVTKVLNTNIKEIISNYNINIFDSSNMEIDSNVLFSKAGLYQVLVSIDEVSSSYDILVYDDNYLKKDSFKIDNIIDSYNLVNGTYHFCDKEELVYSSDFTTVAISGSNSYLSKTDSNTSYKSYLNIDDEKSVIKLSISNKALVMLTVNCKNGQSVTIKDNNNEEISVFKNINNMNGIICFEGVSGTYTVTSSSSNLCIYEITTYSNDISSDIVSISLDTTNVKVIYKIGDIFDISNLIVKTNNGIKLNDSDYSYTLYLNENIKSSLDEAGTYIVRVFLNINNNVAKTFSITVSK